MHKVVPWIALPALLNGCVFSDDFDTLQAKSSVQVRDGGGERDGGAIDCARDDDGTPCGTSAGFLCLDSACVASRCGDGFVDEKAGEQCEPTAKTSSACREDTCRWLCERAADCRDGNVCNGAESCDADSHSCVSGKNAAEQMPCERAGGSAGVCVGGVCAPEGCGDGALGPNEDCDPSVAVETGCIGCEWECADSQDCKDNDLCDGTESCVDHVCVEGNPPSCNDGDNCTADSCAPEVGCVQTPIDLDRDGYSPYSCTTPGLKGGDCEDDNSERNPGKAEQCDDIDNDCNDIIDDKVVTAPCYPDSDGDGFPLHANASADRCKCAPGTIFARKDGEWDCYDSPKGGASIFPGQREYFAKPYCKDTFCAKGQQTWDYDCDGKSETRLQSVSGSPCTNLAVLCTSGWTGDSVPGCGVEAEYKSCTVLLSRTSCTETTQTCR